MLQGSPEWEKWRLGGIGASEIAAIIGICPYHTPHDIWLVKTGRHKGFDGNSFTRHGQEREAAARARYELINLEDMPPACATHPKFTICRASLDGWNQNLRRILEIKCPKGRNVIGAALAGEVTPYYRPQVQYQLAVTGADEHDFFVFHEESMTDALVKSTPDVEYQGELFFAAVDFWERYVLTDSPPPLTNRDVKLIEPESNNELSLLCQKILSAKTDCAPKKELDHMKAEAVRLAGHPKMKCGKVQIATVMREGKFFYHKLTIDWKQNEAS